MYQELPTSAARTTEAPDSSRTGPAEPLESIPRPAIVACDRRTADLWLVAGIVLIPAVVSALVSVAWPVRAGPRPTVAGSAVNTVTMLAGWAGLVAFLISRGPRPASHFGIVRPRFTDFAIGAVLFLAVWQLASAMSSVWGHSFGDITDTSWHEFFPYPPDVWWQYVIVSIELLAVGVVEELVWRGYLFSRWEEVTGSSRAALVGTSLLFGFAHLYQGPLGILMAAANGFLFCGVFVAFRRLWPVAIAHGLYDIVAVITA